MKPRRIIIAEEGRKDIVITADDHDVTIDTGDGDPSTLTIDVGGEAQTADVFFAIAEHAAFISKGKAASYFGRVFDKIAGEFGNQLPAEVLMGLIEIGTEELKKSLAECDDESPAKVTTLLMFLLAMDHKLGGKSSAAIERMACEMNNGFKLADVVPQLRGKL